MQLADIPPLQHRSHTRATENYICRKRIKLIVYLSYSIRVLAINILTFYNGLLTITDLQTMSASDMIAEWLTGAVVLLINAEDSCIYGDYRGTLDVNQRKLTCSQIGSEALYNCYDKDVAADCCVTCRPRGPPGNVWLWLPLKLMIVITDNDCWNSLTHELCPISTPCRLRPGYHPCRRSFFSYVKSKLPNVKCWTAISSGPWLQVVCLSMEKEPNELTRPATLV